MYRNYIIIFCIGLFLNQVAKSQDIQVHYLGHSAFIMQFDTILVVTDYGKPNAWKQWGWDSPISDVRDLIPDIMTYSHLHDDHYDSARIPKGIKYILKNGKNLYLNGLKIESIATCEDVFGDFNNNSYLFTYKGINILHTGDIQIMIANIENDTIAQYVKNNLPNNVDVLIMPIEGKIKYVDKTYKFIELLKPKVVIPAHYWSKEYLNDFITFIENKYNMDFPYKIYNIEESGIYLNDIDDFNIIILKRPSDI